MERGRSVYNLKIENEIQSNDVISKFLNENKFEIKNFNGEEYYESYNSLVGHRGFKYKIEKNNLVIEAWTNKIDNSYKLEQEDLVSGNYGHSYLIILNKLFNELGIDKNNNEINDVEELVNKRRDKLNNICLILSIVSLVLSIFGMSLSIILLVILFYLAINGLKTSKKTKPIISLILLIISALILLFYIFGA